MEYGRWGAVVINVNPDGTLHEARHYHHLENYREFAVDHLKKELNYQEGIRF